MNLVSLVYCGLAFAAGVIVGVYGSENRVITSDGLAKGGRYCLKTADQLKRQLGKRIDAQPTGV